jgi:sortase A
MATVVSEQQVAGEEPRPTPAPRTAAARPARPPRREDSAASVVTSALTMTALVCLWVVAQMLFLGGLSQQRSQQLLYTDFRTQLAGATAPVGPIVPVGDPVALLTIPRLGVQQVVVEGTASGDLLAGPGHRRDTVLPGQEGTAVVYGRATTYGAPFRDVPELVPGDEIEVVTAQGKLRFHVLGVRRAGDPLPQPAEAGHARLTLVTAEGNGSMSAITPDRVVYVDAEAKKSYPAPSGRPTAIPESETAMGRDSSALPLLTLCLAALLAATLGTFWARGRWPTALVWVVASPVVIALSWMTTDVVMRLLPNLI